MTRKISLRVSAIGFLLAALVWFQPALAQYPFGKNKVVYTKRDWKVLKTENVDIYYYPAEENLVAFAAPLVQQTFEEFSEYFDLEFDDPLPLVFFSSHHDFQQTNIIPYMISEYTAGFTDLVKGRVAIPFAGSLWEFRHVIRHEMVHAFMLKKLDAVLSKHHKFNNQYPPLWFIEGLAEYVASPECGTRSHMFIRDAMLHNRLPDLANIWRIEGSFLMYKQGEAIVRYIADNFGDEAITKILENWWVADHFSLVLKKTIGIDLLELNDGFFKAMKRRYYPSILYNTFAPDVAERITEPRTFHARPTAARTPDGDIAVYALGAEDGVVGVIRFEKDNEGQLRRRVLIEGGLSTDFEAIPAFRSKLEVRGDTLMFVSKRHDKDAVYLWSIKKRRPIDRFTFPELSVISSPTFSPEGERIVFSAIDRSGRLDLFLYHIVDGHLDRLTNDTFAEQDPDFHPIDDVVIFSSDRCQSANGAYQGIYAIDLGTRRVTPLTCGSGKDAYPDWSPDGGSFLFSSDRDGIYNMYLYDMKRRTIFKQTSVLGGVTMPSFLPDAAGFVASSYYQGEYHVFEFPLKDGVGLTENVVVTADTAAAPNWRKRPPEDVSYKTVDYKQKLSLDFAGAGVAIDPNFGSLGSGGGVVMTDILGNHQYYVFVANSSQGVDDFLKRLNVGVNYVDLSRRLHFSLGIFHLNSYVIDPTLGFRSEERYGVSTGISYPFSRFTRLDGSIVVRVIERSTGYEGFGLQRSFVGTFFLSHVVDKTLWAVGGPLKGFRFYVTGGRTFDFRNRGFDDVVLHVDIRK